MLSMLVGLALGLVARAWLLTVRLRVFQHPLLNDSSQPRVLALWHGQLLLLLAHRRCRRTIALVSHSPDGERLTWAMRWFGVFSMRGSSSKGGRQGLQAIVQRVQEGWDAALAVDGPRGPRQVARPGALAAAYRAHAWVVPYAAACSHGFCLASWDRFIIPRPFSRMVIVLGKPITNPSAINERDLACAIDHTTQRAHDLLLSWSATKSAPCTLSHFHANP
ncbi:MAG TPA: DUF374 domain-containing protein [Polyangiaceae bacterium]|nr:MAG: hypothetical protein BWY17_00358 [Deltaproteobacteria bacterium ADurb.Bin207]HNS96120.1 DUF374 domain-containing protein [Polyangiaceae bacterium]HNZ22155.1 DUF374 domain-containing protein [Polyangiaceae bacterium]HOD21349.1 DUF374 domain-containing protein [Polyangiaceae bacterium]HOE46979.1 DUF374 domain-containing protein [Polyangiaceae bacterium]